MQTYLNIVQIILGVALIILVLFEVRSSGDGEGCLVAHRRA